MDEGDEYVPQITQMDYSLMGDGGGGGSGAAPPYYDPAMQMYGAAGVTDPSSAAAMAQHQQRYGAASTAAGFHHQQQQQQQQLMQSQQNAQQQRHYMPHQMTPGQHQMYQMGMPHGANSAMEMMNRMPGGGAAGPSAASVALQSQQANAAAAQASKSASKSKAPRKSKKTLAAEAASAEAAAAAAAATVAASANKPPNMVDPRGFPLPAQQQLPPGYQTPAGFNPAVYQQQQAYAMQQKYLYMQQQQQHQQQAAGQQQQQQQHPAWMADPMMNPAYGHHPHSAAAAAQAQQSAAYPPGQMPPAAANFHGPTGYAASGNGMPMGNAGYYPGMKPPFADQQQHAAAVSGYGAYGSGNVPTSSAVQAQHQLQAQQQHGQPQPPANRFPASSSYMSAAADSTTPCASSAATSTIAANAPPAPSGMHPYYAAQQQQQQQQHFPHMPYGAAASQQQAGATAGAMTKPPHMQQLSQQAHMNSSTPTTLATQTPVTSTMMPQFSTPHQQQQAAIQQQQQQQQSHGKDGQSHGPQQTPWGTAAGTSGFGDQPLAPSAGYQPAGGSGQPPAIAHPAMMQFHQQLQQIHADQQRLHREIYDCDMQINFLQQQQPRTPELTQRIEQLKQQSNYERSQFAALQQKQAYIMSSINALSEQQKQQAYMQASGGVPPKQMVAPALHGGPAGPGGGMMPMMPGGVGQTTQTALGSPAVAPQMVSPAQMDPKFASMTPTQSQPSQPQPQPRQPPSMLSSPAVNSSQVSPTGFKKSMEFGVSPASSTIPPSSSFSVMQTSANQVQVNITPEPTGRTLISVYHQQYPMAAPVQEQAGLSGTTPTAANEYSIPPEPVPPKRQSAVEDDLLAIPAAPFPSNSTVAPLPQTASKPATNGGLSPPPTVPTNSWEQQPIRPDATVSMSSSFNSTGHGLIATTSISTPTTSCSSLTTRAIARVTEQRREKELLKVEETLATSDSASNIYAEPIASPKPAIPSLEPAEVVDEDVVEEYYDPLKKSSTSVNPVVETPAEVSDGTESIPQKPDENGADDIVVTPKDSETVAEIETERPSEELNGDETDPEPEIDIDNDLVEPRQNGEISTHTSLEDLTTELDNAEESVIAENGNGEDEKTLEDIPSEIPEAALEATDDTPLVEEQLEPFSDIPVPSTRPSKRKNRKTKAAELMEERQLDDTDEYTETKSMKKKKKASSKDRPKDHKAAASRKRRRPADGNPSSGEDDENDGDFVMRHKKKKISKAAIAKELDVAEENLDDFVEKRRSGRTKVNKNYEDREMDVDLDDLVMDESPSASSHKAERQSTSAAKHNAAAAAAAVSTADDDASSSALPEDGAPGVETPQEEWIVEKILGYRLAKRKVRKERAAGEKSTVIKEEPQQEEEPVATTGTADSVPALLIAEDTANELISEPGLPEPVVVVAEPDTQSDVKPDVTANDEPTESNGMEMELKSEVVEENEIEATSSHVTVDRLPEATEKDAHEDDNGKESTTEAVNESEKEKEKDSPYDEEEVEEEAEQYYVKYKNRSYIHCEWKFADELEAMDKRAAGKISRHKLKCSDVVIGEEYFNEDYVVVDRVLDDIYDEEDDEQYAYVKWRSLPYGECTWESIKNVPQSKIDAARSRNFVVDTCKLKEMPRPSAKEWKKISSNRVFKDGNTLREYQVEGVNWLLFCYFNKQNCILADEMGLGKTVQTITFLQGVYDLGIHGPFLIVVPLSTLHNWEREFETWTDMNAVVYHGSAAGRQIIQDYELYYAKSAVRGESKKKPVFKFDALITTFEMVVSDCEVLRRINYRVCVIDEAHRLKNRNCKLLTGGFGAFKMEHRVLLTGTPLQNNIQELFSLLNFLEPEQFASSESFLEQFGQCQTEEQVQKLQEILKPMMLRRLKEDVEKTLQPKEETIVEIQLSNIQKKYYRAILERNFTHLLKGGSMPSLMNTMMELRKCCNHPFLINGAEEQIMSEVRAANPDCESEEQLQAIGLTQASGKLVLIDKLLPKLRQDGHKVLIFSQMVRVLDLIEEFLVHKSYPFERIDGNVRGDLRQAAIDRFSRQDTERFVFLLCTRAGGLGINLTAADTVIIFDSDWNPQNDLQAQARCHRIGQTKMVKVYRLITSNTYEREMFDKASLKLGLDKAVLQSNVLQNNGQQMTRKEVEDLLRKGAYGAVMEEDNEGSKFSEEDIDTILQRRTQTIRLEPGIRGSTFAKASFTSSDNREDIDINDPNFWSKWAKKVNIDVDAVLTAKKTPNDENLILLEPRSRRKRFEENYNKASESADESAAVSADDDSEGINGNASTSRNGDGNDGNASSPSKKIGIGTWKKRRRATAGLAHEDGDEDYVGGGASASGYRPNELAFNKSEFFKVEKLLGAWGWGRWAFVKQKTEIALSENDMEHISRTLLLYCVREFRGDEKTREFVWKLITPRGGVVCKGGEKSDFSGGIYHEGWAALPEYNPPSFAVDHSFQRHVHRHANKLLARIHHLQFLQAHVIGEKGADLAEDRIGHADIQLQMPNAGEPPMAHWDVQCDKSFLLGVYKHGMENYESMRQDTKLCFIEKEIAEMPTILELNTRFKRLISMFQRQIEAVAAAVESAKSPKIARWPKNEEVEYMNILRTYGVKDDSSTANVINWTRFRELSTCLQNKTDAEMLEQLYCVLAMCTRQQGGDLSPVDLKRADCAETITGQQAEKLMNRIHLMRKIHAIITTGLQNVRHSLKLCSTNAMPKDWAEAHDEALLLIVDNYGLDGITPRLANNAIFQKISGIEEKLMLRRAVEICTTLETGKWNGIASIELIEDDEPPGSVGRYARQKTNDGSRASSGSPGPMRGRGASRRPAAAAGSTARGSQRGGDAAGKSGKGGNAGGTANITSVTSLDLAELEKEKMKSIMQQHQSLLEKTGQTNTNYMMSLLGLSGLTSTAAPSSSKSTATTSAASSTAMQMQAAVLAMTSAFGVSDATTASAIAAMLTGIPMGSLMGGTATTSSSATTTASGKNAVAGHSNDNDALNLSKRKTGNVSASLNLSAACSSSASAPKGGKTSILNPINTRTNTTTSAGSSKMATDVKTTTSTPTASTSAASQMAAIDKFSTLGIAELLAFSNFPPESVIPVVHVDTKLAPAADKMPKLRNLNDWLATHPKYTIDLGKLMQTPSTPSTSAAGSRSRTKETTAASTAEAATYAAGGSITTGGSARNVANKLLYSSSAVGGSSRGQSPANPATRATPCATPVSSAAAASLPSSASKSSASASASASAKMTSDFSSLAGLENLIQIAVFKKSTGASLSQVKWPMLTELAKWLDKNPDCNVHSSYADISKTILPKSYYNRLGGDFAGAPSTSASSTSSAVALNSATAASLAQSLSSVFPSTSSASSTAALTQLLAAASNPMTFNSTSGVPQMSPSTSSFIGGSKTGGNIASTSATPSASSLQNMETLQMQLLLQQLMTPSMMTNYNPYSLLGGTGSASATSNGTANSLNNLTTNLNAGALLSSSEPSTSKCSNNNSANEMLMAALLGLGGSAAEQMLLTQALTGMTTTSNISTATNLSSTGVNKTSNSTSGAAQSLASLTNRVQTVNSMSNSTASSLMAEAALAAEILTNPTLMTSMLNPLGPLSSATNHYGVNNNQSNKSSANSSTAFTSNSLTNPSFSVASSMTGLDAATMASIAATFGGLDAATLAALTSVMSLPTTASTASTSRKTTTTAASSSTSSEPLASIASTSRTTNANRTGLLNAVVEKLAKSSSNTPSGAAAASHSTSSEANAVKDPADEDEEAPAKS